MTGIEGGVLAGIMAIVGILTVGYRALSGVEKKISDAVSPVNTKAQKTQEEFNSFRLEVAQKYTTKEDVAQAIKPVLTSVEGVKTSVDNMTSRIDRIIEQSNSAKTVRRRASTE